MQKILVAAASVESQPGEVDRNLALIHSACRGASREGANLLLCPELCVTGFFPNHPVGDHSAWLTAALAGARRAAQAVEGPAAVALVQIARDTGIHVAAGILEDAGNLLYNTLLLAGPGGVEGSWRKMHVPMFEMPFYVGGGVPAVVAAPFGRVGGNICFDALIPESTRLLAVDNCEIVLFPFAADPAPGNAAAWAEWAGPAVRARCAENGVFGIAVNYRGHVEFAGAQQSFPGGALIVGPDGQVLAREIDRVAGLLVAELDPEQLLAARSGPGYLYRFRRPELYRRLAD